MKKTTLSLISLAMLGSLIAPFATSAATEPEISDARRAYNAELKARADKLKDMRHEFLLQQQERYKQMQLDRREDAAEKQERQENMIQERRETAVEKQAREEKYVTTQKTLLLQTVDTLVSYLEQMTARANELDNGEIKTRILNKIQSHTSTLAAIRLRIANASSLEDIRAIALELKNFRAEMQRVSVEETASLRQLTVLGYIDRFEQKFIGKADVRADLIADALADLKQNGKNVDVAQELLAAGQERLSVARAKVADLRNRVNGMDNLEGANIVSIRASLSDIHNELKNVYDIFRQIAEHVNALE